MENLIVTGAWGEWSPWSECEGEVTSHLYIFTLFRLKEATCNNIRYYVISETEQTKAIDIQVERERVRICSKPPCSGNSRENANCPHGEENCDKIGTCFTWYR